MRTLSLRRSLLAAAFLATVPLAAAQSGKGSWPPPRAPLGEALADCQTDVPKETFEVERVIDGDTIWIRRNGEREKLRLLSVDTEEKYIGGNDLSPSKPSTRFGEQSTGWAQGFFLPRTPDEAPVRVGLRFPGGVEAKDVYGRLLCHVVTREGVDFNLPRPRREGPEAARRLRGSGRRPARLRGGRRDRAVRDDRQVLRRGRRVSHGPVPQR